MTNDELKHALIDGRSVVHNGIEYEEISAVIYRWDGKKITISCELVDKNNCLVIAAADKVRDAREKT